MALGQRDASVLRRFEEFCALEGLRFDRSLDDAHVVEAFLTVSCSTLRAHSLGTYRSTLRRLGRAPRTTREFPASPAPPPYGTRDLAALWSRARHQASRARVTNATVLLATMVGAGLRPREVAWLRGSDVLYSNGRVVVVVPSARLTALVPVSGPARACLRASPVNDAATSFARTRPCATPRTSSVRSRPRSWATPARSCSRVDAVARRSSALIWRMTRRCASSAPSRVSSTSSRWRATRATCRVRPRRRRSYAP